MEIHFQVEGGEKYLTQSLVWGGIPSWLQAELSARYPVCSCGRRRCDIQVSDGYGKCELCRNEETCERCGKQAKITVVGGKLVCENCQPYEEQEQLIASQLTMEYRQKIAEEAKRLLRGQPLDAETGFIVVKAGLGHISSDYARRRVFRRYEGYRWYYFTDEGVFGTKFEPAALKVLQYLPQATSNSLVELVAWVAGGPKPSGSDFYLRTQVEGQEVLPQLTENLLKQVVVKLEADQPVLADWLRWSEAERLAALEALAKAEAELTGYEWGSKVYSLLSEARQALQSEEQDYKLALEKIAEAFAEHKRQKVLEDLLAREYSSCPVCGKEWDFREESHYCDRQDELRAKGQYQDFEVKVSLVGEAKLVSLVAVYDSEYNDYELQLEVNEDCLVDEPSQIETKTYWREPSVRERELIAEIDRLRAELEAIERERETAGRVEGTFEEAEYRGKLQLRFFGTFTGTVENRRAEEGYSSYEETEALFVCREKTPWLDEPPLAGQRWICTLAFQIGKLKDGRPIIVVNPQVRTDRETELKFQLSRLQQELKAEREKVEPFDENGNPRTAMAKALREAGLI